MSLKSARFAVGIQNTGGLGTGSNIMLCFAPPAEKLRFLTVAQGAQCGEQGGNGTGGAMMQNDLISKRDLKEYIRKSDLVSREKAALLWAAEHVPTISTDSLRERGHWIGEGDGYAETADGGMTIVYDVWYCSQCDYTIDDGTDDPELLPNYCPHCGARMDLET